jgi:hypothetical protein
LDRCTLGIMLGGNSISSDFTCGTARSERMIRRFYADR